MAEQPEENNIPGQTGDDPTQDDFPKTAISSEGINIKPKTLEYEKVDPKAPNLEKAYAGDAGFNLASMRNINIMARTQKALPTGIKVDIPEGYYGQIFERSGMSQRTSLGVKAGVIDSGYTGEIKVIIYNYGDYPIKIDKGDEIAQLVILPLPIFQADLVDGIDKESQRQQNGFGSSDE